MDAMRLIWPAEITSQRFDAMWRIYVDAIPAAERKPDWMIRGMWEREDYRVGLAEAGKEIVGFSILFVGESGRESFESGCSMGFRPVPEERARVENPCYEISKTPQSKRVDFYLLEYFAIDSRHRNRGIGGELFRQTIEAASKQCGAAPVLIEVESDAVGSAEQRAVCRKRIEFYRRLGCKRILGLEYLLPLKWPVPAMELMIRPSTVVPKSADECHAERYSAKHLADSMKQDPSPSTAQDDNSSRTPAEQDGGDSISAVMMRRWLGVIYSKVYGREANDPRIEQMLGHGADQFLLE